MSEPLYEFKLDVKSEDQEIELGVNIIERNTTTTEDYIDAAFMQLKRELMKKLK